MVVVVLLVLLLAYCLLLLCAGGFWRFGVLAFWRFDVVCDIVMLEEEDEAGEWCATTRQRSVGMKGWGRYVVGAGMGNRQQHAVVLNYLTRFPFLRIAFYI